MKNPDSFDLLIAIGVTRIAWSDTRSWRWNIDSYHAIHP